MSAIDIEALRSAGFGDAADEIVRLREAAECCLGFVNIRDRDRDFTDIDMAGEMVSVRLTGLCALAEAVRPGCRQEAMDRFLKQRGLMAQKSAVPLEPLTEAASLRAEFKALLPLLAAAAEGKPVTMAAGDWRRRVVGLINANDHGGQKCWLGGLNCYRCSSSDGWPSRAASA